jgi:Mce-associated membrane protein
MVSRERPTRAPGIDDVDQATETAALEQAERAEAEAEAAEAQARAAAARARAVRLRREAEAAQADLSDGADCADLDGESGTRRGKAIAVASAVLLISAALSASGFMAWQHRIASQHRQHVAEFAAAARQDITALMSLDPNSANDDMKRISNNSTGAFKGSFPMIAAQLTKGLQKANVATTVTVNDVAVESMTDNSAIVLVAATTEAKAPDGPPQQRAWHISLGLRTEGGRPKMSHVEFVQ